MVISHLHSFSCETIWIRLILFISIFINEHSFVAIFKCVDMHYVKIGAIVKLKFWRIFSLCNIPLAFHEVCKYMCKTCRFVCKYMCKLTFSLILGNLCSKIMNTRSHTSTSKNNIVPFKFQAREIFFLWYRVELFFYWFSV